MIFNLLYLNKLHIYLKGIFWWLSLYLKYKKALLTQIAQCIANNSNENNKNCSNIHETN